MLRLVVAAVGVALLGWTATASNAGPAPTPAPPPPSGHNGAPPPPQPPPHSAPAHPTLPEDKDPPPPVHPTPPANTVSPPSSTTAPARLSLKPVIGRVAGVVPVSGIVRVRTRSSKFSRLGSAANLQVGATIDASRGVLELVTALPHGKTQSVTVWGGVFQVSQGNSGSGVTSLSLRGALSCPKHGRAHASSHKHASRSLWARDNHGRYRSYGSYSATTVLGTEWETVDSCAGTLTRVVSGKVRVSDVPDHRTVVVSAGHSYFADA
jgi:hypothetical protein